ncbi:MAG TPA: hypothetical protein PLF30_03205 [Candidatus Moranbacteria bacterium]|jgi:hypothetical protein|nr:hypothetical protein [Candidatus Moranbacteria bacterium]HOF42942.1 hypothetical protein [Candidatus Moranbacteria bacterium]HPX94537.1 hypothetical protein [Candidatus Moranbacteria bacterium]
MANNIQDKILASILLTIEKEIKNHKENKPEEKYDFRVIRDQCIGNYMTRRDPAFRTYQKKVSMIFAKRSGAKSSAEARKRRMNA